MKKCILFTFIVFLCSCSFPTYVLQNKQQTLGLDFTKGKWLLNEIEAPKDIADKLTKIVIYDFSKLTNNNLNYSNYTKGLLLNKNIKINLSKEEIKRIQIGTNFDYFINMKAFFIKDEIGTINIRNHNYQREGSKEITVIIEIYDLNNLLIIYSQEVKGFVKLPQNTNDLHFSKSLNSLTIGAYKKIIKDIDKKSKIN